MDIYKDSGIGDPYWYEWYVGLRFILKMLYPDSKIKGVTLQASDVEGIDDVIVEYLDGSNICIQVKHTRTSDNLAFCDIFSSDNSLIRKIALGWKMKKTKTKNCIPILFTNREFSNSASASFISIKEFWPYVKKHIKDADTLNDISINEKWKASWKKCINQLDILDNDEEKLKFLKLFTIVTKQPDIEKMEASLITSITKIFGLSDQKNKYLIFDRLISALRIWSTTRRIKEQVDKEEVFEKLSLADSSMNMDHFLPTPYPFFESRNNLIHELRNILISGDYPIVFLKGSPGCGKSSIISELSNERDSVIYLRYHVFNPITPDTKELPPDYDKKTSAIKLWSDLLDQLRYKLHGSLANYNVPIINEILSVDQIRDHVLRICYELYQNTNKVIVIAIDGIDHAARATYDKKVEETFLQLLIHPEEIHKGVCFIIAGQHPEGYPEYPIWLREKRDDVLQIDVPNIKYNDIKMLIKKVITKFSRDQIDSATRIIEEVSNGNTLAAVFAVYEAKESTSLSDFEDRLIKRKLHDGISAYYNEIWSNALKRINTEISFVNSKISAYLTLSNQLFDGKTLKNIYPEYNFTESDWTNVLRELQPLLIETEGEKFVLLHNDVRVHLMRELKLKPYAIKDVASLLSDYYLLDKECYEARHIDLFKLLQISGRSVEIFELFSPDYIMEAWAIRRPIDEIIEQSNILIRLALRYKSWNYITQLSISLKTVVQLIQSKKYANEINYFKETKKRVPVVLETERFIIEHQKKDLYYLTNVIDDVQLLINNQSIDRASGLMQRWFKDSPEEVLSDVLDYKFYSFENESVTDKDVKLLLQEWGKVSLYTGINTDGIDSNMSKINLTCYNYIYYGLFNELVNRGGKFQFIKYFKKYSKFMTENTIKKLMVELVRNDKWTEVKYILKQLEYEDISVNNRILYAFLSIITCNKELIIKLVNPLLELEFNIIDYKSYRDEEVYLFMMLSFIFGWKDCNIEEIAKCGFDYYFSNKRDLRTEEIVLNLLASSASLGYFYKNLFYSNNELTQDGINILFSNITYLYSIESSKLDHLIELRDIRSLFFKLIVYCSKRSTKEAYSSFVIQLKYFMSKNIDIHQEMNDIWEILNDLGERSLMKNLFCYWTQKDGLAWKNPIDRLKILEYFINLAQKFDMLEEAKELKERVGKNWIVLTNNYFPMKDSIKWIKTLLKVSPKRWMEEGLKVLELTEQTFLTQNTIDHIHRLLSIASVKDGPVQFGDFLFSANLLDLKNFNIRGNKAIYDGVIGSLENGNFSEQELLSFWCFVIGGLTWRDRESRSYIEDTKKAILKAGYRLGYYKLEEKLKEIAPLCFNISQKKGRENEKHWIYKEVDDNFKVMIDEKLHKYSFDEIFEKFSYHLKSSASSRYTIAYANELIKRLKEEKLQNSNDCLEMITTFIMQLEKEVYLTWEEIGLSLYKNFFSLFDINTQGWRIVDNIFDSAKKELDSDRGIINFTKKLDNILLYRAEQMGESEIIKIANLNIEMLIIWLHEYRQFNNNTNHISSYYQKNEPNLIWEELIFDILILNISCPSISQVEAGLQGLWQLIKLNNNLIERFNLKWDSVNNSGKEWLLLFFERLVAEYPKCFSHLKNIIYDCFEYNENLIFRVQAWIVLNTYQRVVGKEEIELNLRVKTKNLKEAINKIMKKYQLNDNREIVPVIHDSLQEPVRYKLYQLQRVLNDSLLFIQKDLLELIKEINNYTDINDNEEIIRDGDIRIKESYEIKALMDSILNHIKEGNWLNNSDVVLSQAISYSEDPFVLLRSPIFVHDRNRWFNYYSLSNGINKIAKNKITEKAIKSRFMKSIKSGVNPNEIVICGQIQYFAFDSDYIFTYQLIDCHTHRVIKPTGYNVGINRSYIIHDVKRYEPSSMSDRLFICATQINRIPFSAALMIPTKKLLKILKLKTSNSEPLTFTKNGKKVLWFENFIGPIRDEKDDNFYRQHVLQRWVCTKEIFDILVEKLGRVEFKYSLNSQPLHFDMRDLPDEIKMFI